MKRNSPHAKGSLSWFQMFSVFIGSMELAITCMVLLMVLVVCCTLSQVSMGIHYSVSTYIRSLFIYWSPAGASWSIPVFPGGGLVGAVFLVNISVAQSRRLELSWKKAGLWAIHLGMIVLFLGEFVTGAFQVETRMAIREGETLSYLESPRAVELAIVERLDDGNRRVFSISERALGRTKEISVPGIPFSLVVKKYYSNSVLEDRGRGQDILRSIADKGVGPGIVLFSRPPIRSDDRADEPSAFVELLDGDRSLGTWLVSTGISVQQTFEYMDRSFSLSLRPLRTPLPFSFTLKDFRREVHPGTDVPRHFSSLVRLIDERTGQDRDVLISMNEPFRYEGLTFYQASFGMNDTLTVLQVVDNPGWVLPYLAGLMVGLGLLFHFAGRLRWAWRPK